MKHITLIILGLLFVVAAPAQQVDKYWVQFTDKNAPSPYTLDNPSAYLGPRALERRRQQRISIDSLDLPVCQQYVDGLTQAGLRVQNRSKWFNGVAVFVPEGTNVSFLDTMPFVRSYQWVEVGTVQAPDINPAVPSISLVHHEDYLLPHSRGYYNKGYDQIKQLNGIGLHRDGFEGQGVIIGVCDGGFPGVDTLTCMAFMRDEGRLLATRDFVWDGDNVYSVHDHGTVVLSTMAGYDPGLYVGTAPQASYILCRTENTTIETLLEEYNWVAAAEYLDSMGADIITSSLGYYYFDFSDHNHTLSDLDGRTAPMTIAADIAVSRGMLVINAAGNDGQSNPQHLNAPADAERVLTVGACTIYNDWAPFSSHGPTADLRVKPDVMALGSAVYCIGCEGVVHTTSGTSLATPILAGMMACFKQRCPHLTPQQLCDSVRAWGSLASSPDDYQGYGIPDFGRALQVDTTRVCLAPVGYAPLVLYPNPVRSGQVVHLRGEFPYGTLQLVDPLGRIVANLDPDDGTVRLPQIPAGIYVVRGTSVKLEVR